MPKKNITNTGKPATKSIVETKPKASAYCEVSFSESGFFFCSLSLTAVANKKFWVFRSASFFGL
jgi:hypothetical protein